MIKPPLQPLFHEPTIDDYELMLDLWDDRDAEGVQNFIHQSLMLARQGRGQAIVVRANHQLIGCGLLTFWPRVAEISDVVIRPQLRNLGLGTALIEHLVALTKESDYGVVEIGVLDHNLAARRLYERLNFVYQRTIQHESHAEQLVIHYLQRALD